MYQCVGYANYVELGGAASAPIQRQRYFIYPPHKVNHFVERVPALQSLQLCLSARRNTAEANFAILLGLGGCGKTQLALAYCQWAEHSGSYDFVLWIDAASPFSATQSFTLIAEKMVQPGVDISKGEENIRLVLGQLESAPIRWLLVFDNFDDPSSFDNKRIQEFLPRRQENGSVIITSRHVATKHLGIPIDLTSLTPDEALELLMRRSCTERTESSLTDGKQIVQRLGFHALAVDQAGAYIARGVSFDLYMKRFERHRAKIMNEVPKFNVYKRKIAHDAEEQTDLTVFTTWELSLALILGPESMKADKEHFLTLLGFFNGSDIFAELFENYGRNCVGWMKACRSNCQWDTSLFEEMLMELRELSLLQSLVINSSGSRITMHPLIQDWVKLRIEPGRYRAFTVEALCVLHRFLRQRAAHQMTTDIRQSFLMNCDTTLQHCPEDLVELEDHESTDLIDALSWIAGFYQTIGRYNVAYKLQEHVLKRRATIFGEEDLDTLASMNNLASVLDSQGKYEQAEEIHHQVLGQRETVLGKEHPDTLTSMNNLALILGNQGKYEQAEEIHRQVLGLRETMLGKEHPDTLGSMGNLASVLWHQGRFTEAEELESTVLESRKKLLGQQHPDTLMAMENLAYTLESQGREGEAKAMFEEAGRLRNTR